MRYLPDDNLSYPVLIELNGGSSGSGFYLNLRDEKVFLVTALHVLFKMDDPNKPLRASTAKLTSYDQNLQITTPIELEIDLSSLPIRKNDTKDLVLVEISSVRRVGERTALDFHAGVRRVSQGNPTVVAVPYTALKKFNDVLVSNEVFLLGYPNSLSFPSEPQIEFRKPLLRKGVIAGKNLLKETIILDCPVYFGNSGGLAIEVENVGAQRYFKIIGVVSQYIPFVERLQSLQLGYMNVNYENSGYSVVVPIDTILDLTTENPS
jgi:hypothetical protein